MHLNEGDVVSRVSGGAMMDDNPRQGVAHGMRHVTIGISARN